MVWCHLVEVARAFEHGENRLEDLLKRRSHTSRVEVGRHLRAMYRNSGALCKFPLAVLITAVMAYRRTVTLFVSHILHILTSLSPKKSSSMRSPLRSGAFMPHTRASTSISRSCALTLAFRACVYDYNDF